MVVAMFATPPIAFTHWTPPSGFWRERGACAAALRLGMGLSVSPVEAQRHAGEVDQAGFTLWHYWAESPDPSLTWPVLSRCPTLAANRDKLSLNGEHPWHRLAGHGRTESLQSWSATWGSVPLEPTAGEDTVLHWAAWSGNGSTLEFLLNGSTTELLSHPDNQGYTPLTLAVHRLREQDVARLLLAGSDPNVPDHQGRTPLHHAALYGDHALMTLMEQSGGDGDLPDHHGDTPYALLHARREKTDRDRQSLSEHWRKRYQVKMGF